MRARTEPPERDCEVVVEDLVAGPRIIFLFSLNAATLLRRRRPQRHRSRHMDAEKRRMERRSDLHSTRNRSLEGRRESLYYAPGAREGSTKTQGLMSYQKRVRVTKPCFSNCTIRGTGPSARPRRNAASRGGRVTVRQSGRKWRKWRGGRWRAPEVLLSAFRVPPEPVVAPAKRQARELAD